MQTRTGLVLAIAVMGMLAIGGIVYSSSGSGQSRNPNVIARVDGHNITRDEFQQQIRIVERNSEFMRSEIENESPISGAIREQLDLIEDAGVENAALAGLISDYATYAWAKGEGYSVPDDEVSEQVAESKRVFQQHPDEPDVSRVRDHIADVGEEEYWNEVLPDMLERSLLVQKASQDRFGRREISLADLQRDEDEKEPASWQDLQLELVNDADIEINDPDAIAPATVDDALAYMADYSTTANQELDP